MANPHELSKLEAAFESVLGRPDDDREAALDDACAGDDALREKVVALLAAHDGQGVVDDLAADLSVPLAAAFDQSRLEGRRIGPYRLTGVLGRGGMGNVYAAERVDGQFEQQVALKLLRDGIDSESTRARFVHERQLLARLNHPGIARLLDGGLDDAGRPYFAMEVVRGERIDRYCDSKRLGVKERLGLFCQAADAVQYAHGNLVVHRDLKPSNIMVRTDAASAPTRGGHVVLLDFGIAKLLEGSAQPDPDAPVTRVMTPEYAAPEQVRGEAATTAADIYSLGVILYELLAGKRPYDVTGLSPGQMEDVICNTVPTLPSEAVSEGDLNIGEDIPESRRPKTIGANRSTEPDTLARLLSGDLDTIVMKALSKEPERRYVSAEAFLNDVRRHLDGLPVLARPDTAGYRLSKFVRRNKIGVFAAIILITVLFAGVAGVMWQAAVARSERDRARIEANKSEHALSLLVDLFKQADPGRTSGDELTARDVLDRASDRIALVDEEPVVRATLLDALGGVYHNLGLYERAGDLRKHAIDVREGLGSDPTNVVDMGMSMTRLAESFVRQSDFAAAESLSAKAVDVIRSAGPGFEVDLAVALHNYAATLRSVRRSEDASQYAEEALALQRANLAANHPDIGATMYQLAAIKHDSGDFAGAEPMFREALALLSNSSDSLGVQAADAAAILGQFLTFKGEFDEAERLLRRTLYIRERLYGEEHPSVIADGSQLGMLLYQRGDFDTAEPYLRKAVEDGERVMGSDQYDVLSAKQALALTMYQMGNFEEAVELLSASEAGYRKLFGGDHGVLVSTLSYLGNVQLELGNLGKADAAFRESAEMARRVFGEDHPYESRALQGQAAVANRRGRLAEAEATYIRALEIAEKSLRPGHYMIATAQKDLGRFYVRRDRAAEGVPLLESAVATYLATYDSTDATVLNTQGMLGEALAATGDVAAALPMLRSAVDGLTAQFGSDHRYTIEAVARLRAVEIE